MNRPSRGFRASLVGVALTLLAWVGPWSWPAWPALLAIRIAFPPERSFAALPFAWRGAIVVAVIALNVAAWAATWLAVATFAARRAPRLDRS
ncbi:MAG: hypothetical protein HYU52_13490 [Acidobacteria bacterium]|nr:hypothetical protein [Acidobacteriota bacterium]